MDFMCRLIAAIQRKYIGLGQAKTARVNISKAQHLISRRTIQRNERGLAARRVGRKQLLGDLFKVHISRGISRFLPAPFRSGVRPTNENHGSDCPCRSRISHRLQHGGKIGYVIVWHDAALPRGGIFAPKQTCQNQPHRVVFRQNLVPWRRAPENLVNLNLSTVRSGLHRPGGWN